MIVHYKLFKHGKFYPQRDHIKDMSIFDFVGPLYRNPVAQAISAMVSMLLNPLGMGREHLSLLLLKLGSDKGMAIACCPRPPNCPNDWHLRALAQALHVF